MRSILTLLLLPCLLCSQNKESRTVYSNTRLYDQVIADFSAIDKSSEIAVMTPSGMTDAGKPLHVFVVSKDKLFTPEAAKNNGKCVIMINNAIHPGEPDGIDASYELVKTYTQHPDLLPSNVVLVIIPVYNIDGYLNRGSTSRANQNGPEQYGFRGNAKNLDLNRDFIKADAQNTISFEQIFQLWKPHVLIDNHVSDGADYQYTMALIATQHNKLHPILGNYLNTSLVPAIYDAMGKIGNPICPYVETMGETPESGIVGFLESPRFATGYAALFNCIGFVPETHMLKPYNDRVWATYDLMKAIVSQVSNDAVTIIKARNDADRAVKSQRHYALDWQLDTAKYDLIDFRGYESTHIISKVTGLPVLYYDKSKPYNKKIKYYNTYKPARIVESPSIYIVPQAWTDVIFRLQINGVQMRCLSKDTLIDAEFYSLTKVNHPAFPYESHYHHRNTQVSRSPQKVLFLKGDYVIQMNQVANRYIVETLDPQSDDSFFAWNFFDGVLNQKEWFSDYVFDAKAAQILKEEPSIKKSLDSTRAVDTAFAKNHWAQMNFIYQRSRYKEPSHNRYPVAMLKSETNLPLER
ncbi:MAG: hypothetical protein L6Q81_10410 [Bacteroidia bacterium]|nr:hypothetical protein [Bacteroidia bacterium]